MICRDWDQRPPQGGTAVVIDVLRFSTTICALLQAGRKKIWVADKPEAMSRAPDARDADAFSELAFEWPGRHLDNSPVLAFSQDGAGREAFVTTTSGSRALWASRAAQRVLIGGFANFGAVLRALADAPAPVRFVPAAPPIRPSAIEDELCAEAFIEALGGRGDAPQRALERLRASARPSEFFALGIPTDRKDFDFSMGIDGIPVLPEAEFPPESEIQRSPFAEIRRSA